MLFRSADSFGAAEGSGVGEGPVSGGNGDGGTRSTSLDGFEEF